MNISSKEPSTTEFNDCLRLIETEIINYWKYVGILNNINCFLLFFLQNHENPKIFQISISKLLTDKIASFENKISEPTTIFENNKVQFKKTREYSIR